MSDILTDDVPLRDPKLSVQLDALVRLRWLAVIGQLAAVLVVAHGFEFDLPVTECLAIIALESGVNIALQLFVSPMHRLRPIHAGLLLALNILELAALLFLTGGLQNPFSFLFLAPVLISATALPPRLTLALGVLAAACATVLAFYHMPLPWKGEEPVVLPLTYMFGVWLSILVAIGVTSLYAFQVTEQARKLSDALNATELVLAREQLLTQLDGLAAAAAHELGTPLATITLIAGEMEKTVPAGTPLAAEVTVLREQAKRCRDILGKLTQLSSAGQPFDSMPLSSLIEEVVAPHRDFGIAIHMTVAPSDASGEPIGTRNPAILYGLGNILENAVDFGRDRVDVTARADADTVEIVIADDGSGIPPEVLSRLGTPYLSRRQGGRGLGLGVFIAKTLLERSGAQVSFTNRKFPDHGAVVRVTWPRGDFEKKPVSEPAEV